MATIKRRLYRKNASGSYDTVHYESESSLILRPSGRTVEQDLADFLPKTQASDSPPASLKTLLTGISKAWVGMSGNVTQEVSLSTHTHNQYSLTNHTHSNYVTSTQVKTIVKEVMDVVKLVDTTNATISANNNNSATVSSSDYVVIRGLSIDTTAASCAYHIICAKGGTAGTNCVVNGRSENYSVVFDGTIVTFSTTASNKIIVSIEAYKYQ